MPRTSFSETLDDLVTQIHFTRKKRKSLFLSAPLAVRSELLLRLSKRVRADVVNQLDDGELLGVLNYLDPDRATDVIQLLPKRRQKLIIPKLRTEMQRGVELLSQFDPDTAAGLMNIDYIQVQEGDTMIDVARLFQLHEKRTGRLPAIVVLRNGKISGYLPGHVLGLTQPGEIIKKYVRPISTINHDAAHDAIIRIFKEYPHNKVVVTGGEGHVIGIIYSDDILRVLHEENAASLYDFAGVQREESVMDSVGTKVVNRYQWLIINLGTAFLAAFTVSLFDSTLSKYVLLAVYMPVVAGMGGNAATQTLAVVVRGIALKQIALGTAWKTLKNEIGAGVINGMINGILVATVVYIVNRDVKIAFVLAVAMLVNLSVAAFFGTLIPLIMKRFGKDPASSATVFITTATDVLGFLVFLGLATLVLS